MAGTLRQAMVFLGLADDGYDEAEQEHRRPSRADRREDPQTDTHEVVSPRAARRQPQGSHAPEWDEEEVEPREAARRPEYYEAEDEDDLLDAAPHRTEPVRRSSSRGDAVRTEGEDSSRELVQSPSRAVHRREEYRAPVTPINRAAAQSESDNELRRITTIHPRSYNDAKVIGESFRSSIPVIMNVTDMDVAEAKRLVDFSSGLTFALNGSIERVTEQVFLLTPANLEVLASEDVEAHAAAADEGVFNQN